MNPRYRTHSCGSLSAQHVGQTVKLAGWMFRRRDHGGVVFVDLRDTTGVSQVVFHPDKAGAAVIDAITHMSLESVISVEGVVLKREEAQVNPNMPTGEIELDVLKVDVLSKVESLPYALADDSVPEELRLKHRYLDLRTERMQKNVRLRNAIMASLRKRMWAQGFDEFQTPILTSSSPEGARDFLVPSRLHPGKFYALPQAPQQFKQLLMVSGFDRYFQIAPCFRDEDARADRSPGEFYQMDMEMSFVEQEDIFRVMEDVTGGFFEEFANGKPVTDLRKEGYGHHFPRIPYAESMLKYGCDKPDLRNPLVVQDVSDVFAASDFAVFKSIVAQGGHVRAIPAPTAVSQPRSWFDKIGTWAQTELHAPAAPGYITWTDEGFKGPLFKFIGEEKTREVFERCGCKQGDAVFFVAAKGNFLYKMVAPLRNRIGEDLGLCAKDEYRFCWIVDFPMFEHDEDNGKIDFSHNPFSMPQGGLEALETQDPLTILAYQYDLVCNGIELSSGAIRNHRPEIMYKAFEIAGYPNSEVDDRFGGMIRAFKHGAPPHGGMALGIDRIVMILADTPNIREVIIFPLTQRGEDLLMGAPSEVKIEQLRELSIRLNVKG